MKKKFFKKKIKLIKKLNIIQKQNLEQNSSKLIQKKDYNIFNNINTNIFWWNDSKNVNNPFPSYANLLDNYNFIQYKNIKIPRISITSGYQFDNYKKPLNDLFEKINLEYKYSINHFQNLSKENNNIKENPNNNLINNIKLRKNDIIIDIKNEKKDEEKSNFINNISFFNYENEYEDNIQIQKSLIKNPFLRII